MRRRRPAALDSRPVELMDARRWPQCARWDGGTQPCVCWFARAQREWIEVGNVWAGNDLTDLMDLLRIHECHEPFDQSKI